MNQQVESNMQLYRLAYYLGSCHQLAIFASSLEIVCRSADCRTWCHACEPSATYASLFSFLQGISIFLSILSYFFIKRKIGTVRTGTLYLFILKFYTFIPFFGPLKHLQNYYANQ